MRQNGENVAPDLVEKEKQNESTTIAQPLTHRAHRPDAPPTRPRTPAPARRKAPTATSHVLALLSVCRARLAAQSVGELRCSVGDLDLVFFAKLKKLKTGGAQN